MTGDADGGEAVARRRLTRAQSRQQTRARLLAAAAELFAEQGVNGASVEQIAERAGYSRGAFYANFDDKDELVLELLKQRTLREVEEVRALRQAAGSFEDVLERLRAWNIARGRHLESWLALRLELILHAVRNPRLRPLLAERELIARRAIAAGIEQELRQAGAAPPAETAFLALIVHALEDGLLIQRLLAPDEISEAIVVDAGALLMHAWAALGRPIEGSVETS
jgi:AcrR family transcriptional regulator